MKKLIFIYLITGVLSTWGQQVKDSVKTEVIEVTRSFEPKVQDAYKLDVNPDLDTTPEAKIPVTYQIQSVPVASTFQPEKGKMAGFNPGNMLQDIYTSYVSGSIGNYTQVKADAYVYYAVSDQLNSALRLSHYSSQGGQSGDYTYNPFYHTAIDAIFDYKTGQNTWQFDLGYDGHINHLNTDPDIIFINAPAVKTTTNKHNNFHLDVNGQFKDILFKNVRLSYNNLWDVFDNSEHTLQLKTNLVIPISSVDLKLGIQTDLVNGTSGKADYLETPVDFDLNYQNTDIGLLPAVQIENDKLVAHLGAKLFYQNHPAYNKIQFIPDVNVSMNLIYEKLSIFAGVTGDLKQQSQTGLYARNPYLNLAQNLMPTLTPYNIFGGFNGAFSSAFSYEVKMGVKKIYNYAFYHYNMTQPPVVAYSIVYDDMTQSYFKTDFNIGIGKKLDLKLGLTYMQNNTDHLKKPLFIPDFDFKTIFIFKPNNKLNFNMTLNSVGKRNYVLSGDKSLKAYTDLNIGVRYNINKEFTAFIDAYNVLNQEYEIYYLYPVQTLQLMGGVAYRFDIVPKN